MASQNPLQVPEITIPAHSPKPYSPPVTRSGPDVHVPAQSPRPVSQAGGSYFSLHPHPPSRSSPGEIFASPESIQRTDTSNSSNLLKTPSGPESRQESSSVGTPRRPQRGQTRPTSPSDQLSNPASFSPGLSSTGSFYSSEYGHSQCSHSSSELLTPPRGQPIIENPPYKARRLSSESLTMVRKLRRANTMPHDKEHKRQKRRRKYHRCGHRKVRLYEHQNRSCWWLPSGCQVAPTAPPGQKQLCEGHAGHYTPRRTRYGNIDTYGKLPPDLRATPARAVVTRRWSSVEIGANQIMLESTLPFKAAAPLFSTPTASSVDNFIPKILGKPYRSSTFTRGAIDHDRSFDIVHTVRKLPGEKLTTPESITLRRASGESSRVYQNESADDATPRACEDNAAQKRLSETYLITAEDIDSITELIEANLRRNYDAHGRYDRHTCSSPGSEQTTPSSSITGKTIKPSKGILAQPTGAISEAPRPRSPLNYLQVVPEYKTRNDEVTRTESQKSVHEIIWESGGSPRSLSDLTDEDDSNRLEPYGSEPATPQKMTFSALEASKADKGDAFDPKNAKASINEWSWRCPQNEIAVVLTSSDSDSKDVLLEGGSDRPKADFGPETLAAKGSSRTRARPPLRPFFSETTLQDVVSFPPLKPRKKTNDWHSPLPPMEMSPPLSASRSLYDLGIDVSLGPSSSTTVTPKSSQTSWARSPRVSPSPSIEFDPSYDIRPKSSRPIPDEHVRKKSVIKAHPTATARTGDPSTVGSSLGISSRERRKSSNPNVQRQHSSCILESAAVRALISTSPGTRQGTQRAQTWRLTDGTSGPASVDPNDRSSSPVLGSRRTAAAESIPERGSEASHPKEGDAILPPPRRRRVRTIDNVDKEARERPPTKWRAPSRCPTPRSPSPSEYTSDHDDARESPLRSPDSATTQSKHTWVDRLSLIRARSPPLLAVDRVGIYGQMTGGQGAPRGDSCEGAPRSEQHACDICPKPSEPHVCDDCAKDPRTLSVDWIG
ncbi:hypothetical protein L207DRAFT_505173 [Hyaloscypha variabilis F]|uniref:Uncharacterized protein n=1 Tax=Hyaloscypha variabilis (strain UAMH 11265 / GT02V1 / F) TaxID=1149755 RepID=A0A2J6SBF3_HYAVF|nr:hypothetical protein L207DRAFT_505173 [Hyaloscypha variabilis F]